MVTIDSETITKVVTQTGDDRHINGFTVTEDEWESVDPVRITEQEKHTHKIDELSDLREGAVVYLDVQDSPQEFELPFRVDAIHEVESDIYINQLKIELSVIKPGRKNGYLEQSSVSKYEFTYKNRNQSVEVIPRLVTDEFLAYLFDCEADITPFQL